jgi:hypothetical protein
MVYFSTRMLIKNKMLFSDYMPVFKIMEVASIRVVAE